MARRVEKYREMNTNELEIQQRELAEQIFRLRFQLSTGQAAAGTAPSAGGSYYILGTSASDRTLIGELDTVGGVVTYTGARLYIVRIE